MKARLFGPPWVCFGLRFLSYIAASELFGRSCLHSSAADVLGCNNNGRKYYAANSTSNALATISTYHRRLAILPIGCACLSQVHYLSHIHKVFFALTSTKELDSQAPGHGSRYY